MKFYPEESDITEFKSMLKEGSKLFNEIITSNVFPIFCNVEDSDLTLFLVENIEILINNALYLTDSPKNVAKRCLAALSSNRAKFYQPILNQTKLLNYMEEFIKTISSRSRVTQNAYFIIMDGLTFNSTKLFPCFSNKSYIKSLVENIDINECYSFLALLLMNGNVNDTLEEICFMDIVVEEIAESRSTLRAAQSLFVKGFDTPFASTMLKSLIHNNCFATIVQNSIDKPSSDAFDFLRYIAQIASQRNLCKQWKEVLDLIESRLPEFIIIMMKEEGFTRMSEAISLLVIVILKYTKKVTKYINTMFVRLGTDFWVYKTNSFLHNSFLKLLQAYAHTKMLSKEMINRIHLFEKVCEAEENNGKELASYIGQVRRIAEIINPYFKSSSKLTTVTSERWRAVMNSVKSSTKIINSKYGGDLPWKSKYQQFKHDSIITIGIIFFVTVAIIYFVVPVAK